VHEQWEHQAELVAVERPLRLTDHHRVEAAVRILQLGQQRRRLWATRPRQRPGLTGVEELGHDHPTMRLNQRSSPGQLPRA
jgi:hypothetical protein